VKISKGLQQAYDLQEFTFGAVLAFKESLSRDGKLKVSREDATAIGNLVRAWESCQERVRIHRGKPLPGSLKPEPKPKKSDRGRGAASRPSLIDLGRSDSEEIIRLRAEVARLRAET
jgi:hypothetical protein